jgi:DNA-binding Lrp family transcriptional regulator
MGILDKQEIEICRQLIMDPRLSDNQIGKRTKIPAKTVNRKRKSMEEKGLISYFTYINTNKNGTGSFGARDLYIVKFRHGVTRKDFMEKFASQGTRYLKQKHILASGIGEFEGGLSLVIVFESRIETDIIEIFNAEIVPELIRMFGANAIEKTVTMRLDTILRIMHNYIPILNMDKGILARDWKGDNIFVDDTEQQ